MEPHGAWIPDLLPHCLPPAALPLTANTHYIVHDEASSSGQSQSDSMLYRCLWCLCPVALALALSRLQLVAAKWKHTSRSQIARLHSSTTPQRGQRKKLPAAQWDKEGQRVAQIKWKFITIERGREKLERLISSCDWHYWQYYARLDMCICGVKRLPANVGYSIMRICENNKTLLMARLSTLISLMILRKTA